jgi:hypothetical protein
MPIDIELTIKFLLVVLLTQFGKTFVAISRISTELANDEENGRSIHVIFTMNTLLNNRQFAKRLSNIEEEYGNGSVVVFASKYEGKYKHVKSLLELQGLCMDSRSCPRIVVMCSNKRRYEDGVKFLRVLEGNNSLIARAFVYYDELHTYINKSVRAQIEEIHGFDIVKSIIALSATPDKIWQPTAHGFWSHLKVLHLDNFNDADYSGCGDMIFNQIDDYFPEPYERPSRRELDRLDRETLGFIRHVLDRDPEILTIGSRCFIPGHIRRSGHYAVRDLVFSLKHDAVVVILNGEEKSLQYHDAHGKTKTIPLTPEYDEEVCKTISTQIIRHGLTNRPLVISGFLCVGMGQTLTHESIGPFTSAIIGHLDLPNDEVYQLFGRVTGRTKKWRNYCPTEIYCPTKVMHRVQVMEECARRMAVTFDGETATRDDYRAPIEEMGEAGVAAKENIRPDRIEHVPRSHVERIDPKSYRIFSNFSIMKKWCKVVGYKVNKIKPEDIDEKGFIKVGLNKAKEVSNLKNVLKKVSHAYGGGKNAYRTYLPCYENLAEVSTVRYVVVVRKPKEGEEADAEKKIKEADSTYPSMTYADE